MPPTSNTDRATLTAKGRQLFQQGHFAEAGALFSQALDLDPGYAEARIFLSHVAFETGNRDGCLKHLETVANQMANAPKAWLALADRYRHFGMRDQALSAYDKAIALDPKATGLRAERAHYQQTLGEFKAAESTLIKLIKRHPTDAELYRLLSISRKPRKGDPILRQMLALWKDPRLNDHGRMNLGYALAAAMEGLGEPTRVFRYLDAANAAQGRLAPYNAKERADIIAQTLAAQEGADFAPVGDSMTLRPVFVVGMPRSGTTLVEQIIASHSLATTGGEMGHALRRARLHFGPSNTMTPLAKTTPAALTAWAKDFQTLATRDTSATTGVVTDKAMQTEQIFGLIRRGMPGARLIVVHRDPRDIALSIYRNHFNLGDHRYANALADIAAAIKAFRATIAHWRARLPHDALFEIRYEDLVADPEPQARALVAAAGLDWEDACLSFHENRTTVQTLSLAQVRQPIHAGRRQAWRKYEADMQPFIDAWGDDPWD